MSSNWTLVTGANGFLGSRLVKALLADGHRVKALVRGDADLAQLRGYAPEQLRIAQGDVRIVDRVFAAMTACERVYHLASPVVTDERLRSRTVRDAVLATSSTLEAARRAGVARVVVVGSALSLGVSDRAEPFDEGHAFNLVQPNAYAKSKQEAEQVALEQAARGVPVVVVNPGVAVGAGDARPSLGGAVILHYLGRSGAFAAPVAPGGLNFIAVDDVVQGLRLAMDKGRVGERYALGGENLGYRQFYQMLADLTGLSEPGADVSAGAARARALWAECKASLAGKERRLTVSLIDDYFGRYVYLDDQKARRELGFRPQGVQKALAEAVRWYLDHGYVSPATARSVRLDTPVAS